MDRLVPMLKTQGEEYVRRYTRKKGTPKPRSPVSFTAHDLRDMHRLINSLNETATSEGQNGRHSCAFALLHLADQLVYILLRKSSQFPDLPPDLTSLITRSQGLTHNNLGCHYLRLHQLPTALSHFEQAFQLQVMSDRDLGALCSNLTTVLLKLKKPETGLVYAQKAVELLEKAGESGNGGLDEYVVNAYWTLGRVFEELEQGENARVKYQQGYEKAREKLGKYHALTTQFAEKIHSSGYFSDTILAESPKNELKIIHQKYHMLSNQLHKVIIYRRSRSNTLRCVVFPQSKSYILKLSLPDEGESAERVVSRLEIREGELVLGEGRREVVVTAERGEERYSAVVRVKGLTGRSVGKAASTIE